MQKPLILYEIRDQVAHITLNRPEKRNAFNTQMCLELARTWERLEQDPQARVALLKGAGKGFCAGLDVSDIEGDGDSSQYLSRVFPAHGKRTFKPIVSAVHGFAAGLGFSLAVRGADLTIVAEGTRLMFPESKIGYMGGILEYQSYMPFKVSLEVYMTGDPINLQRAYDLGLVNKVVPEEKLLSEAEILTQTLVHRAPLTLRTIKYGHYRDMETMNNQVNREYLEFIQIQKESEDAQEGIRAFREKRAPVFKGR